MLTRHWFDEISLSGTDLRGARKWHTERDQSGVHVDFQTADCKFAQCSLAECRSPLPANLATQKFSRATPGLWRISGAAQSDTHLASYSPTHDAIVHTYTARCRCRRCCALSDDVSTNYNKRPS